MKKTTFLTSVSAIALALAGCGSGSTRTVSVSSSPPAPSSSSTTAASTHTSGAATAPTSTPNSATGGTSSTGRASGSGSGPAFVTQGASAPGVDGAEAQLRARGYSPVDASQYRSDQTLKVLVGAQGAPTNHVQQAFFFVNGRYLGTDTSRPSGQIKVVDQNDTEVTLGYSLYRSGDSLCCPTGGQATVRYELDNGQLTPLDPIPATGATGAAAGRQ